MTLPRFYPIVCADALERRRCAPLLAAEALLEAGAGILQFRHKRHFDRTAFAAAAKMAELCRDAHAEFVINDRADMAMLLDADLHVGQDDLPAGAARKLIGAKRRIGFSTHNEAQLLESNGEPVDYVALGPLFGTVSKNDPDPVVGVEELARLRPLTVRPLVAIGGITRSNAPLAWQAGADSVAVIGDLLPEDCSKAALRRRAEEWIELSRK